MINFEAYQAAIQHAAYFLQPNPGFLRLGGSDRIDFMQRQSTNDLRQLSPGHSLLTVLTSPTARILDVLCLIDEGETLGMITLPGRQVETVRFLRSRIFFSDQVSISDLSSDYEQVLVVGPQAATILEAADIHAPELNAVQAMSFKGQPLKVIALEILFGIGFCLFAPSTSTEILLSTLAKVSAFPLDADTFETLRVEAGQPGPVGEFQNEYTPLEISGQKMISNSKGCYTGQEIIARQITYDKVTKHLSGIKLDGAAEAGKALLVDGKPVGALTSVVNSPRFGWIGLGVIRRPFDDLGRHLTIFDGTESLVNAEITPLPFV
jgi:folate-binding protein YgfZ